MKKILSLVLVLSMVLGSIGFAFAAPTDVEGTEFEDAVTRLAALEILSGFPDGTFRPEETVTRAQFAKIMVTALGVGEAAKYAAGQTVFADVAGNHWAAGYINVASDMKIINGYGDGNFGPEDQVTYAQAVTMIVRALGYEPKATAMGGYPGGYLAIAAEKEITEDVNVVNTLAAIRGDVAVMVDASLTVPMMVQKTWGQYPEYEEDESKTLMTTKLGVDEIKAVVTDVPNTDSSLDADEIKVGSDTYTLKTDVKLDSLLGLEVTVWADGSDVFFVDIETDSDDIKFDTVKADSTSSDITLQVEDDTFEWATDAKAYVNFSEVKLDKVPAGAYGYVVLNDKEEVTAVNVFDFDEVPVGVVYNVEEDVYSYVDPTDASEEEIELSDYEDGVFIYNDKMELVDADEIDVNSAIYAWETSDELYLIVKNEVAQGKLEKIKDKEITVDGTDYDSAAKGALYSADKFENFAAYDDVDDLSDLGNETVTVVLDLNGETVLVYGDTETTSSTMYGVVTYTEMGSKAEATVFTKDGNEVDYVFEERTDANEIANKNYFDTDATNLSFGVMKFKLNADGKIDTDYVAEDAKNVDVIDYASPATTELFKDADKNYVYVDADGATATTNDRTKYYISEDTIFMTALNSDGKLDPTVVKYEDIYKSKIELNDAGDDTLVYVYGTDGKDADFILFLDKAFEGADDDYFYGIVTDGPWKEGSDDKVEIDVFGEGKKDYAVKTASEFVEGNIVKFHFNNENEIVRDAVGTADDDQTFDYDGGYLTDIGASDKTYKIASDAVVYGLDSNDKIDEAVSVSKVDDSKYEDLVYILDADEIIVAATVVEKTETTPTETTGLVAQFINATDDIVVYDGTAYAVNATTLLYDDLGNLLETGATILDNYDTALKTAKADIVVSANLDASGNKVLSKITLKEAIVDAASTVAISGAVNVDTDATVTVTLTDLDGNAYAGLNKSAFTVTTTAVGGATGTVTLGDVTEGVAGTYTFTAQNNTAAETYTITVEVDGVQLTQTVNLVTN